MDQSKLKPLRLAKGLSMKAVGDQMGLHFTTIDKLERGKRRMSAAQLVDFARIYGAPVGDITGEDGASPGLFDIVRMLRDETIPADIRAAAAAEKLSQIVERSS